MGGVADGWAGRYEQSTHLPPHLSVFCITLTYALIPHPFNTHTCTPTNKMITLVGQSVKVYSNDNFGSSPPALGFEGC